MPVPRIGTLGNIVRDLRVMPQRRMVEVDGMMFRIVGAQEYDDLYEFLLQPLAEHLKTERAYLRKVSAQAWALYIPSLHGQERMEEEEE